MWVRTAIRLGRSSAVGGLDRRGDRLDVVAVVDPLGVPAVGREAGQDVLAEGHRGRAVELDVVVVVEDRQLAQPEVAGERGGLGRDALLEVAVGADDVRPVVDDGVPGPVELAGEPALGDGHPDAVRDALAERAGGRLDARGQAVLGVARRPRAPLPEVPEVVERDLVAGQVEERVEEHRGVAGRQDEAVAVGPVGAGRGMAQEAGPQGVGHRRHAHRGAGMPGVRLLDAVDRERPDGVDGEPVEPVRGGGHGWSALRCGVARIGSLHCSPGRSGVRRHASVSSCRCRRPSGGPRGPRRRTGAHGGRARRPHPRRRPRPGPPARARHRRPRPGHPVPGRLRGEHGPLARPARGPHLADLRGRPRPAGPGARRGGPIRRRRGSVPCGSRGGGPAGSASSWPPAASARSWPTGAPPTGSHRATCDRTGSPGSTSSTCRPTRSSASRSAWPGGPPSGQARAAGALVSLDLASIGPLLAGGREAAARARP